MEFEKLVESALHTLHYSEEGPVTDEAVALRAIAYAVLALATAIKEASQKKK